MIVDVMDLNFDEVKFEQTYSRNRYKRGVKLYDMGNAEVTNVEKLEDDNYIVTATVDGYYYYESYNVVLEMHKNVIKNCRCECDDYVNGYICKHIIATSLEVAMPHTPSTHEGIQRQIEQRKKEMEEYERQVRLRQEEERKKREYERRYTEALGAIDYLKKKSEWNGGNVKLENDADLRKLYTETKNGSYLSAVNSNSFSTDLKIEPRININGAYELEISFKVGQNHMYIMKDIEEFFKAYSKGATLEYGKNLKFDVKKENFQEKYQPLLEYVLKYGEMISYSGRILDDSYYFGRPSYIRKSIEATGDGIDEFFETIKDEKVNVTGSVYEKADFVLTDEKLDIKIDAKDKGKGIQADEYQLSLDLDPFEYVISNKYIYVFCDGKIYKIDTAENENIVYILSMFKHSNQILVPKDKMEEFSKYVIPSMAKYLNTNDIKEKESFEALVVNKLASKIYLDLDSDDNIIMELKFCYLDCEFNILDPNYAEYVKEHNIVRDVPKEREVLKRIFEDGFELSNNRKYFTLSDEDATYDFLSYKIASYMNDFEVLVTDRLKNKKVRSANISNVAVKLDNGLLELDISKIDIDLDEIKNVLNSYNIKKKYYKLKNGDYLNLQQNEDLDFLNDLSSSLDIKYDKINSGIIKLPANRSLYLEQLLNQNKKIKSTKNGEYTKLINNIEDREFSDDIKIEEKFENVLRDYQKTGYKWLKGLDHYKFGGILADDMGLGKTLQVIALISSELEEAKKGKKKAKPSIVVCPSSLVYNWKAEIEKWCSGDIKILAIKGDAQQRKDLINSYEQYNLVITSYDLLKRDVEEYEGKQFRFVIADEAQYIKNFATQNATALKSLEGETRIALTGTPIENSISELWSIFDFIMPGYLYNYSKFRKNFEIPIIKENNEKALKRLKFMISPFVLRRVKSEVLTELPEKNITVMTNEMTDEQQKIYISFFAQTKKEVAQEINANGFEKSKLKILMLLTRLRQICCHPSLFIEDYAGGSGKLNQCMDIISEAIASGHKILLFSGYTSMFGIIEQKLKEENIEYFKLTGATPVDKRVEMVEQFNKNEDIKIFLISLKAGGTGLNLTGADVVIHYDPWWNVSAENQATDRAYRIGQKNSVQVYKLITGNSIEEKINKLQEKKAKISEQLLSTEETFVNNLSKEEIMELFE